IKEDKVGVNVGIRRENSIGQANDSVEVELPKQFFLYSCADSITKENTVRHYHTSPSRLRLTTQFSLNQLEKQKRGLSSLLVFRKIAQDYLLCFSSTRRISENDIHSLFFPNLSKRKSQCVPRVYLRRFDAV